MSESWHDSDNDTDEEYVYNNDLFSKRRHASDQHACIYVRVK